MFCGFVGDTAELTPRLVFNGVPLAHASINADSKLLRLSGTARVGVGTHVTC